MTGTVHKSQRYVALVDAPVKGLVHWRAPMTSGFVGTIPAGTLIECAWEPFASSSAASFHPVEYEAFERLLVPVDDREAHKYDGYDVVIDFDELARAWKLVQDDE